MRVAILDDDPSLLALAESALRDGGFSCHRYPSARELHYELQRESFDLLIVDCSGPAAPGPDWIRELRELPGRALSVLVITDRDSERDAVDALDAGADDYMVKPLRAAELVARARAILRRALPQPDREGQFAIGRFRFDLRTGAAWNEGTAVELTQKEFQLAVLLLKNVGKPLSRGHIREMVWGRGTDVPSRTMDTHVSRVRSKLDLRPEHGYLLAPVYSYGYRLEHLGDGSDAAA